MFASNSKQAVFARIPVQLNQRLDAELLRQRFATGRRISRVELLIDILSRNLPELPSLEPNELNRP
jgi:hypothetical protein